MKATLNNYQGALMGLAVGDALGATTENMRIEEIKAKYVFKLKDIVGGGWLGLTPGDVTDDTEMTLCVARGLLKAYEKGNEKGIIRYIGDEFVKWFNSRPKDVGSITALAIMSFLNQGKKADWMRAGLVAHKMTRGKSAGNGSLMRCLPVALTLHSQPDRMEWITDMQSSMTHFDSKAAEACLIYNRIAVRIINGETLVDAILAEIKGTRYDFLINKQPFNRPSGYVVDTFEWVLYTLLETDNYEDVVVTLANLGSDSDTTSAIAGGLAGLYYGLESIPERLRSKIIRKEEILKIAEKLYNLTAAVKV